MMTCIIVDDEPLARKGIEKYVSQLEELHLMGSFDNAKEAIKFIQTNNVDILLLDIQMREMTGLEMLATLEIKPLTILITANAEYGSQAYDLDVIDYLVKPVLFNRFEKAIAKAKEYYNAKQKEIVAEYLFAKVNGVFKKIMYDDILYIEAMSNYIAIVTLQGKNIIYQSIKSIEEILPKKNFMRIHKSFVINKLHIHLFTANYVEIAQKQIPIGRLYKTETKNWK
jgi:DNA-binding LytR/AlgR family response regulator